MNREYNLQYANELLKAGKARKHGSYDTTNIICFDIKKKSGTAGKDVNFAYVYSDGKIEIVTEDNTHYGMGYIDNETLKDTSNRSCFEVV